MKKVTRQEGDYKGHAFWNIPVGQLIVMVIIAALIGVVAAILPARRAAKLNILEAISYE